MPGGKSTCSADRAGGFKVRFSCMCDPGRVTNTLRASPTVSANWLWKSMLASSPLSISQDHGAEAGCALPCRVPGKRLDADYCWWEAQCKGEILEVVCLGWKSGSSLLLCSLGGFLTQPASSFLICTIGDNDPRELLWGLIKELSTGPYTKRAQ